MIDSEGVFVLFCSTSMHTVCPGRLRHRRQQGVCVFLLTGRRRRVIWRTIIGIYLTVWAGCVAIDILPDDVLLIIFYFDGLDDVDPMYPSWHRLVHVCRRWRSLVFASPNFLDLRLVCGPRTRVELIGIWPPFPITIKNRIQWPIPDYDFNAAIVHRNRVREIDLRLSRRQLQRLISAMREPFPDLMHLNLSPLVIFQLFPMVFRWICPAFAISQVHFHSIPCAPETSFVRKWPCPPYPFGHFS
jgi:hypothetical protein